MLGSIICAGFNSPKLTARKPPTRPTAVGATPPPDCQPINGLPATPLAVPNLSATVFGSRRPPRMLAFANPIQPFVRPSPSSSVAQNWPNDSKQRDPRFDDGGFFFLIDDPQRIRQAKLAKMSPGEPGFPAYGSTTADGLRSLAACGLPSDHPRRIATLGWVLENFSAVEHPGHYIPTREHLWPTLYYYFCYSAARTLAGHNGAFDKKSNLAKHPRSPTARRLMVQSSRRCSRRRSAGGHATRNPSYVGVCPVIMRPSFAMIVQIPGIWEADSPWWRPLGAKRVLRR